MVTPNPYLKICYNCEKFCGYSNTGYFCGLDKASVNEYDSCSCIDKYMKEIEE